MPTANGSSLRTRLAFGGLPFADVLLTTGRKTTFIIGRSDCGRLGLGGIAQNQEMLSAARGLQVFAALLAPHPRWRSSPSPSLNRGTNARRHSVSMARSLVVALPGTHPGGVLTEYFSWRWCLLINIPVCDHRGWILAVPLIKQSRAEGDRRYDIPGAITATLGLGRWSTASRGDRELDVPKFHAVLHWCLDRALAAFFIEANTSRPLLLLRVILDRNRGGSFLTSLPSVSPSSG